MEKANGCRSPFVLSDLNTPSTDSAPACTGLRAARRGSRLLSLRGWFHADAVEVQAGDFFIESALAGRQGKPERLRRFISG